LYTSKVHFSQTVAMPAVGVDQMPAVAEERGILRSGR
jgi:hypothetical protein